MLSELTEEERLAFEKQGYILIENPLKTNQTSFEVNPEDFQLRSKKGLRYGENPVREDYYGIMKIKEV